MSERYSHKVVAKAKAVDRSEAIRRFALQNFTLVSLAFILALLMFNT